MRVDPGELNRKAIFIQHYGSMENGFPVHSDVTVRECAAKLTLESGTEHQKNGREEGEEKARILVRDTDAAVVDRTMQVYVDSVLYDIDYVRPYFRSGYTEMMLSRVD